MNSIRRTLLTFVLLLFAVWPASAADQSPDLIVVISIDMFPYEYITRFSSHFEAGGFNRFLKGGANFPNAWYAHSTTFTGPGHATIGTGRVPADSGIIANLWYDRKTDATEYCVEDARAKPTAGTDGMSPVNLAEDSLGDRLKEKYPASRVFGAAFKDRSAILMAGKKADAAYWFDSKSGSFVSSSYYQVNPTVLAFNRTLAAFAAAHTSWTPSGYIPEEALAKLTYDPPELRKYKNDRAGLGVAFPHPIKDLNAVTYTPFGNDLVLDFARHIISTEWLGRADGSPDILYVGLSSPDYLGHQFGPDSLEVADAVVRTDRSLGRFFEDLEKRFGSRVTVALSADHGVQSIPEVARALGRTAGRVEFDAPNAAKTIGEFSPQRRDLELQVAKALKVKLTETSPRTDSMIIFFEEPSFYVNWKRIEQLGLDGERVKTAIRDLVRQHPGVSAAFTNTELMKPNSAPSALELSVRNAFRADRSGDVLITLKEGFIWSFGPAGTNHGQPVERDQHVPLMFWGAGIRKGSYPERAAPTDLAKTLGALMGVDAGGSYTRVLECVGAP